MLWLEGLWIPDGDSQLFEGLQANVKAYKRPVVDGRIAWRYDRILAALEFLPEDRRRMCIDVGAHIGLWTRWLAREFKLTIAFEPIERHRECLVKNLISDYGLVQIQDTALGDCLNTIEMVTEFKVSGRSHVRVDDDPPGVLVDMVPLDIYDLREIDLIKIDVEGFEARVLQGARNTIKRWKPVIVVEQLGHEQRYGEDKYNALELLFSWGAKELRPNMKGDYYLGWT